MTRVVLAIGATIAIVCAGICSAAVLAGGFGVLTGEAVFSIVIAALTFSLTVIGVLAVVGEHHR